MHLVHFSETSLSAILVSRALTLSILDKPAAIIRHSDAKQIIVNQRMVDVLATPSNEATNRIMTRFWLPETYAILQQKLSQEKLFRWRYEAALNERTWAEIYSEFEVFWDEDGSEYRQVIMLEPPVIKEMPLELSRFE